MDPCYRIERINKTPTPLLPYVTRAYILTMATSKRLNQERLDKLSKLCRHTYVQKNFAGTPECVKPECVREHTGRDLCHAVANVCKHAMTTRRPILILEDDAVFKKNDGSFAQVDAFLRTKDYDAYSLGSLGPCLLGPLLHPRLLFVGFAQAIIYSPSARQAFLKAEIATMHHIDMHFLSKLHRVHTYWKPLVMQTFPPTANMCNWCLFCNGSRLEKVGVRLWTRLLRCVGLHKNVLPGWHMIYAINYILVPIVVWSAAVGLKQLVTFRKGGRSVDCIEIKNAYRSEG